MKWFVVNLILCAFCLTNSDAYCNKVTKNMDLRLKSDLLCDYDADTRPTAESTPISMKYVLRSFDYDEEELLTVRSTIQQLWNDSRLKWEPEKYNEIKSIYVSSAYLWTPKLFLNDSHYDYGIGSCEPSQCLIRDNNQVACVFPCHQKARCKGNYTDWPFDVQSCSVVFKTFLTKEDTILDYDQFSTGTSLNKNGNTFRITSAIAEISPKNKTFVKFVFTLQRISNSIYLHVLVPGYILIGFTLTILFMKHGSMIRTIFCGVSIYLHFSLMDRVWWQIPSNGAEVPRLVKYMTMMLLFTSIVFIETIALKVVAQPNRKLPVWLNVFLNFLSNSNIFKYCVASPFDEEAKPLAKPVKPHEETIRAPEEPTEIIVESTDQLESRPEQAGITDTNDWTTFCRIVDRTFFIALSVGYATYNGY